MNSMGVYGQWGTSTPFGMNCGFQTGMNPGAMMLMGNPMAGSMMPMMGQGMMMNPTMMMMMMMQMMRMMMQMQMQAQMQGQGQGQMQNGGMGTPLQSNMYNIYNMGQPSTMEPQPSMGPQYSTPNGYRNYGYHPWTRHAHRDPHVGVAPAHRDLPHRPEPASPRPAKPHDDGYIPVFQPLRDDIRAAGRTIEQRHERIDGERRTSRQEYAAGDHGLAREGVNQIWADVREGVGNAGTAVATAGRAAYDVAVEAPVRVMHNVGHAAADVARGTVAVARDVGRGTVAAAQDAVAPIHEDMTAANREVENRNRRIDAEQRESRAAYAAGEHGLVREGVTQVWAETRQVAGNAGTRIREGVNVAVDTVAAPARFIGSAASRAWGGITGLFHR